MGCWVLPDTYRASAKKFNKLMKKPWIAEVFYDEALAGYTCNIADLANLYGTDDIFDHLEDLAQVKKKNFDARPVIKEHVRAYLNSKNYWLCSGVDFQSINLVREGVGLKAYKKDRMELRSEERIPRALKEAFSDAGYDFVACHIQKAKLGPKWIDFHEVPQGVYVCEVDLSKAIDLRKVKAISKEIPVDKILRPFDRLVRFQFHIKNANNIKLAHEVSSYYLEFKDKKSSKFWNATVKGKKLDIVFGKIGTAGRLVTKTFSSKDTAMYELYKLFKEKTKKGYKEVEMRKAK